jgi:hypothetical protein
MKPNKALYWIKLQFLLGSSKLKLLYINKKHSKKSHQRCSNKILIKKKTFDSFQKQELINTNRC